MAYSKYLPLILSVSAVWLPSASANTDPTSAKLKIYGVAVSANADCSNATVIGYNSAGTTYDFLASPSPSIVQGSVAAGTYQCVILYMDDLLTFVPAATTGTCTAGTTYSRVLCNAGNGCVFTQAAPDANNILQISSAAATPTASTSADTAHVDKVLLFISTGSVGTGNNAFQQPTGTNTSFGLKLASPFVVTSGGTSGTFVINFAGQVNGGGGTCDLGPPAFSFR